MAEGVTFKFGDTFKNFNELREILEAYEECTRQTFVTGTSTSIKNSEYKDILNADKLQYVYIRYDCIFSGDSRTRATERETRTFKKGCPAFIKLKLDLKSKDRLVVYDISLKHEGHENSEMFWHLIPKHRRLSLETREMVEKMLLMEASAKLIKNYVAINDNKLLLNKDLANIKAKGKKKVEHPNDLTTFCKLLREEHGCTVETLCDENRVFKALYFSNQPMRDSMSAWPELVLVDGTYKLLNRNLTLMIFLVQNGIGRGEIVGSALLAYEDKDSLKWVAERFQQANQESCKRIKCIMTDKDLTERAALREVFPLALLLLCIFHTLKAFKTQLNHWKFPKEKLTRLENIIQDLVYCSSEHEYNRLYNVLQEEAPQEFIKNYYDVHWHNIREEWTHFQMANGNFGNYTNNLLESLNNLVKQVVKRRSTMYEFGTKYFQFIQSHNQETDIKSALQLLKTPTKVLSGDFAEPIAKYRAYLTEHAFTAIRKELKLFEAVKLQIQDERTKKCAISFKNGIIESSPTGCSCEFRTSWNLPCKHIFAVRKFFNMDLFDAALCLKRWTKDYTFENHRLNKLGTPELTSGQKIPSTVSLVQVTPRRKKPSVSQKRKESNSMGSNVADLLFNSCNLRYENRCATVTELIKIWSEGCEVKIIKVKPTEISTQHHSSTNEQEYDQQDSPLPTISEENVILPVARKIFGTPSKGERTTTGFFPRKKNQKD